jgi:cobalt-zinc-cadmium resistance protein CzcA
MAGLPGLEQTRSLSRDGLSQVTVIFKDGTDIYFARQLVNQRLQEARERLPAGVAPSMGPISTGLGEIYLWTVEAEQGAVKADGSRYTLADLREIQDWVVKPQLRNVPGVTEINAIGGFEKQYVVAPDLERLGAHGLNLADVVDALEKNNNNQGAGYIERRGEQYLVRAAGQVRSIEELENIILGTAGGQAIRIRDVAAVEAGRELRTGAATENGEEVVLGTVFMLMGENSRSVSRAVDKQMAAINKSLPAGVRAITVYDRTVLVDKAIATVQKNLVEGAALVIAVLFAFLGNVRAALITAMVIPLSMLFTFTGMVRYGISANLMSLGALDFGIIVDGAVVIIENAVRRLAHVQAHRGRPLTRTERLHEVFAAAKEARRPLLFGQLIIMVVYLPILALGGVEGNAALGQLRPRGGCALHRRAGRREGEPADGLGEAPLRAGAGGEPGQCAGRAELRPGRGAVLAGGGQQAGQRVRAEPERRRLRDPGAAHPGHQPDAVGVDAKAARSRPAGEVPRDPAHLRAHRHGRDRRRPDAAEHQRRLHHAEAAAAMARAAQDARSAAGRDPRRGG